HERDPRGTERLPRARSVGRHALCRVGGVRGRPRRAGGPSHHRRARGNHARVLAERIRALGGKPGPACVDDVLAAQLAELRQVRGFVAQLDALKTCSARDAARMEPCQSALRRGFEAAKERDPETHRFWAELYSEEKVSGDWYRAVYSALTKGKPWPAAPVLAPEQVVRRAARVTFAAGEPVACAAGG